MGYDGVSKLSGAIYHADINNCLKTNYRTNRELCTADAISVNAFYKPCVNSAIGPLTVAQRRASNWGWGNLGQSTIYQTIVDKWDNAVWSKMKPTGGIGSSPYRLQDFNGYDHNSDIPFKLELGNNAISSGAALRFSMADITELNYIHTWGYMSSTLDNMGIGVYVGQSKPSANGFYFYLLAGKNALNMFRDIINDSAKLLNIPSGYLEFLGATNGTWYCIPFLIADTSAMSIGTNGQYYCTSDTVGKAMLFPTDKLAFSVTPATEDVDLVNVELYDNSNVTVDELSYRVSVPSLVFKITNSNNKECTVGLSTKPTAAHMVGSIISGAFSNKTVTVAANSTTTVDVVGSTVVWETYNLAAYVDVTITVDGLSRTENQIQIFSNKE